MCSSTKIFSSHRQIRAWFAVASMLWMAVLDALTYSIAMRRLSQITWKVLGTVVGRTLHWRMIYQPRSRHPPCISPVLYRLLLLIYGNRILLILANTYQTDPSKWHQWTTTWILKRVVWWIWGVRRRRRGWLAMRKRTSHSSYLQLENLLNVCSFRGWKTPPANQKIAPATSQKVIKTRNLGKKILLMVPTMRVQRKAHQVDRQPNNHTTYHPLLILGRRRCWVCKQRKPPPPQTNNGKVKCVGVRMPTPQAQVAFKCPKV